MDRAPKVKEDPIQDKDVKAVVKRIYACAHVPSVMLGGTTQERKTRYKKYILLLNIQIELI